MRVKYLQAKIVNLYEGKERLGTGGAIIKIIDELPEQFFLTYGDNFLRMNFLELENRFKSEDKKNILSVYKNDNKYDKSNIHFDEAKKDIIKYEKNPKEELSYIDYGISGWRREWLRTNKPEEEIFDFNHFIKTSIEQNNLLTFIAEKRFYEIGTPHTLEEFKDFYLREVKVLTHI